MIWDGGRLFCVRTIVVWKLANQIRSSHVYTSLRENHSGMETDQMTTVFRQRSQLRENHSGMETECDVSPVYSSQLRENHSGMETAWIVELRSVSRLRENHSGMET